MCGPDNPRGLHLTFEREDDHVITTYTPPADFGGYGTILHGGLQSTLLDEAMAWAVYGLLGKLSMTIALKVRFVAPVRCGDALTITGALAPAGPARAAFGTSGLGTEADDDDDAAGAGADATTAAEGTHARALAFIHDSAGRLRAAGEGTMRFVSERMAQRLSVRDI